MKRLFIGGSKDCELIDLDLHINRVEIPIVKNHDDLLIQDNEFPETAGSIDMKYEVYKIQKIHATKKLFEIFVESSLTIDDALQLLIDKYADK